MCMPTASRVLAALLSPLTADRDVLLRLRRQFAVLRSNENVKPKPKIGHA